MRIVPSFCNGGSLELYEKARMIVERSIDRGYVDDAMVEMLHSYTTKLLELLCNIVSKFDHMPLTEAAALFMRSWLERHAVNPQLLDAVTRYALFIFTREMEETGVN